MARRAPAYGVAVAVPTSSWRLGRRESIIIRIYIHLCRAAWLFPLLLIASCETTSPASTITTAPNPKFEQHTCTSRNVDATLASRMRCGTVRVPRDYARPDGLSFALSVVLIQSETEIRITRPGRLY